MNFAYPDGGALTLEGTEEPNIDLAFRVLSVPEPTSLVLFAMGMAGLFSRTRR